MSVEFHTWIINLIIIIICGFVVSSIIGIVVNRIATPIESKALEEPVLINGVLEFCMYSISIYVNAPEFLVLWIGVKTALKWDRKIYKDLPPNRLGTTTQDIVRDENRKTKEEEVLNKQTYLKFLIGNALMIIASFILACVLKGQIIIFE